MSSALTKKDRERLGISDELAEWIGDLVDSHGPLTTAQRDRIAVLLRPAPEPLPRPRSA